MTKNDYFAKYLLLDTATQNYISNAYICNWCNNQSFDSFLKERLKELLTDYKK